jgi:hypothetical protein
MYVDKEEKFPKGTYKVQVNVQDGYFEFLMKNLCTNEKVKTHTIWNLVKSIENNLSENKFPEGALKYRTWGNDTLRKPGEKTTTDEILTRVTPEPAKQNGGATFIIKILYRQNATWQGSIQWLEGKQSRQYRSVNELLNLIDEALERSQPEQPN